MAATNGTQQTDGEQVSDDDGSVDRRIKKRIQNTRERIDQAETKLYVQAETDPQVQITPQRQTAAWGTIVKQYIRSIEPLLQAEDIDQSEFYYNKIELGKVHLPPPDIENYRFSLCANEEIDDSVLRRELGLPRSASIPRPVVKEFHGLKTILDGDPVVQHRWAVTIDDNGPPSTHERVFPSVQRMMPKHIYEHAVREADQFLQQAGFGLDIDDSGGDHGFEYSDILENGPPNVEVPDDE